MIDFTENGNSEQGNPLMEANPGGAPCNMLAMIQKLGGTTAFIGKVGKDMFGRQLKTAVEAVGIDTRNLMEDEEVHTTLAFVHTFPDGDRDFSFYRNPGADMMLTKEEIPVSYTHLTGAGDTFTGCMLNFVLEKGLDDLTESDLAEMLIFANV